MVGAFDLAFKRAGGGKFDLMRQYSRITNYFDRARTRAARRKSPWNILLIVACFTGWLGLAFALIFGLGFIHQLLYVRESLSTSRNGFTVILATIPLLLGCIPPGFMAGNLVIRLIPPARKVLDSEAAPFPETTYSSSQRDLGKLTFFFTIPCFVLSIIGTLLPW
jgi:hypothetical protein